jgi:peptidoglycan hydrolase-like protein with peptidoglycan-binding domain
MPGKQKTLLGQVRPRWALASSAVLLLAVVAIVGVISASGHAGAGSASTGITDNSDPTSIAKVTRQPLSAQVQVDATLGYAGSYAVVNQARGTVTALPALGQVVSEGQVLYRVNGSPVVLLYGQVPAYRSLSQGMSGPDVAELNSALVALGYASSAQLRHGLGYFGPVTAAALDRLQSWLGVPQDGVLALGQAVFVPAKIQVTALGTGTVLGGTASPGAVVLSASSTTRVVTIDLDADQQTDISVGDQVTITLPDNQNTPGVVSSVGTVASDQDGTATITVEVTPEDPAVFGTLDQAPVEVAITTASVPSALAVPVDALLALAGGGYAVEVIGATGIHHLVAVSVGLFDDAAGLVQVTGADLAVGQRVVVPAI